MSAVVSIKRQTVSLHGPLRYVRSGLDKAPSCELMLGSPSPPPCQLHRATQLRSHPLHFASTASPHSPPPQSIKMQRCTPTSPTAHMCVFPRTDQSSDPFITWAAGIILRYRSFILSINICHCWAKMHIKRKVYVYPPASVPALKKHISALLIDIWAVCWDVVLFLIDIT